jgi:hypothetical protein
MNQALLAKMQRAKKLYQAYLGMSQISSFLSQAKAGMILIQTSKVRLMMALFEKKTCSLSLMKLRMK